jgi:MFS family permease
MLSARSTQRAAWLGFLVVLASAVMDLLDSTIAQTAAPAIRADLGGSYADLQWISAAYTLAMSVTLLLGSRLGDLFGRRRVLLAGIGSFSAASALCALAPSPGTLIAARSLQGAVAAIMVPQGFGLIRELFGDEGQQKAFGVFGPVMGLAAIAGPLVGGGLVNLDLFGAGWRMIFLVNVPVGLIAVAAGQRLLPRNAPSAPGARLDPLSIALAMIGGVALVYPLIQGRQDGWPAWSFGLLGGGVVLLAVFGWLQARRSRQGRTPLVEPSILRRRPYVAGLAVVIGFIGAMGGMMIAFNVMYQLGLGFSPLACAVATITVPIAAIAGSITSSALLARIGRTTMHAGVVTMAIGLAAADLVMRMSGAGLTAWELAGPLAITGYGMGMVFVPMFDVILAGVAPHELGSASGLLESVQQLSMSLGIAAVGTVLFDHLGGGHGPLAFVGAADHGLLVAIAFLIAACLAVFWLPKHARRGISVTALRPPQRPRFPRGPGLTGPFVTRSARWPAAALTRRSSLAAASSSSSATPAAPRAGSCARAIWKRRTSTSPTPPTSSSTTCAGSGSCSRRPGLDAWCTSEAAPAPWRARSPPSIVTAGRRCARSTTRCWPSRASTSVCGERLGCGCATPTAGRSSPSSAAGPGTRS